MILTLVNVFECFPGQVKASRFSQLDMPHGSLNSHELASSCARLRNAQWACLRLDLNSISPFSEWT